MEQTDKRKQDKLKFDRVINLARRLPQPAIHDLLRALILPIQADYLREHKKYWGSVSYAAIAGPFPSL
uniref:hypothetical protein n=1 Tax=Citrobacter freundii TaxID=546 RepID=UPI001F3EF37D|nr:hypothetical protein [Citrobacter freundii]